MKCSAILLLLALVCGAVSSDAASANHPTTPSHRRQLRKSSNIVRQQHRRHLEDKGDPLVQGEETDPEDEILSGVAESTPRGLVDLVHLVPFDVQIAVTVDWGIEMHEVNNLVTDWMNQAYRSKLEEFGYTEENRYAEFDSVVLFDNSGGTGSSNSGNLLRSRRHLQNAAGELYTAKFRGGAVFTRSAVRTKSVPANDVLLIQQVTLLNDTALTVMLQESSVLGFGPSVVDVNAFLNPNKDTTEEDGGDDELELVIVVAISVACVAFVFLLGAIVWAYLYDRSHREAFRTEKVTGQQQRASSNNNIDRTDSDTANDDTPEKASRPVVDADHSYPAVIGGDASQHDYPDSVISDSLVSGSLVSEDISTSLSQYYRAGMGRIAKADYGRSASCGLLDDAGSVSSMESYGYSLDGGATATVVMPDAIVVGGDTTDVERIGGLPVAPDGAAGGGADVDDYDMEDVQIPDLDKELANLDIKLSSSLEQDDDDDDGEGSQTPSYSALDLEEYQKQDLEELEQIKKKKDPTGQTPTPTVDGTDDDKDEIIL